MASHTRQNQATFVDTVQAVQSMVASIAKLPTVPDPDLYIDLEGTNLCREGTLSIVIIHVASTNATYIVDVTTLKHLAFDTPALVPPERAEVANVIASETPTRGDSTRVIENSNDQLTVAAADSKPGQAEEASHYIDSNNSPTLRSILESPLIPKVFFDVRNDSDALFMHYGISLKGIHDLQLMEVATRDYRRLVHGLARCISRDAGLAWRQAMEWEDVKDAGKQLFNLSEGNKVGVFDQRPMPDVLYKYCVNDVVYLPRLREKYWGQLSEEWRKLVLEESAARVRESQSSDYRPQGREKAEAPEAWSR